MKFHEIMRETVINTKDKNLRSYRTLKKLYRSHPYSTVKKDKIYHLNNSPTFLIFLLRKVFSKSKVGMKKFLCFAILNYLTVSVSVYLGDYKLSVGEVKILAKIKNIKKIKDFSLRDGQITNLTLIELSTVESIKFNSFPIELVNKLIHHDKLRNLKSLTLPPKTRIEDYEMEFISQLKHLKKINFTNTYLRESGTRFIIQCSGKFFNIEKFDFTGCKVSDYFLDRFVKEKWYNLNKLILNNCAIRDSGFITLLQGNLNNLTGLELNNNLITDYGFNQVFKRSEVNLQNLKRISLLGNKITSYVRSLLKTENFKNVKILIKFLKPRQSFSDFPMRLFFIGILVIYLICFTISSFHPEKMHLKKYHNNPYHKYISNK